jgi:hypothetical protein
LRLAIVGQLEILGAQVADGKALAIAHHHGHLHEVGGRLEHRRRYSRRNFRGILFRDGSRLPGWAHRSGEG